MTQFPPPTTAALPPPLTPERRLHWAINGLRESNPDLSAERTFIGRQRIGLLIAGLLLLALIVVFPMPTFIAIIGLCTLGYLAMIWFRASLMWRASQLSGTYEVTDDEARAIPDDELPIYTVMVPAFREPAVIARLLEAVGALDYPADKLDLKILLEADDPATIDAARAAGAERFAELVIVPVAEPRTKPKALNYGLQTATGSLLTIYDAEDRPEPLQLRRAVVAMSRAPENVACLQAELAYFNPDQNIITRWFSLEYTIWFTQFLPGLSTIDAPIPLGGTSNHFRREVLDEVGGWDPFNVTEDADLGLRLHRRGYRTGVLGSVTLEEANSDFVNWVKQRSRWYKGYLQTWLVHMRHPLQMKRDLGVAGFLRFNLFVAGTPMLALLNPIFWVLTAMWFLIHPHFIQQLFPAPVYYAGLGSWLFGNFVFAYSFMYAGYVTDRPGMTKAGLLAPLYWVMMSLAALKAALQLIVTPNYWEKTQHGLDTAVAPVIVPNGGQP